jgi:glycosyltransferase involved in cell wall biosynthesis
MSARLTIVIPTRHRAALAVEGVRSLLSQDGCDLRILVSDNSSDEEEVRQLQARCDAIDDPRLLYLRPAEILPMPAHWDWALEQAMARTDATHFGIQYDRKLWKPDTLATLTDICARAPDRLIAYLCGFTFPLGAKTLAWHPPVTGKLFEIETARTIEMTARGRIDEIGLGLPLLSNCLVPRQILERVRARFGTICDSSTPDAAFAYRFCATEARYLLLDRDPTIVRAFDRSNGRSMLSGESGGTWGDFRRLWGERPLVPAAPIPDLCMGQNFTFHEYELVRRAVGERFPPIDRAGYLRQMARGLDMIENPAAKSEMYARLVAHGLEESRSPPLYRRALARLTRPFRRPVKPLPTFPSDAEAIAYLQELRPGFAPYNGMIRALDPVEARLPD